MNTPAVTCAGCHAASVCESGSPPPGWIGGLLNERPHFVCGRECAYALPEEIWLQLSYAYMAETALRTCKICGELMVLSSSGFQSNREFCSGACKQKDHRKRVNHAKSLQSVGMDAGRIARKMNVPEGVINNWLKGRQRTRG